MRCILQGTYAGEEGSMCVSWYEGEMVRGRLGIIMLDMYMALLLRKSEHMPKRKHILLI
jgi:hypothetical protein